MHDHLPGNGSNESSGSCDVVVVGGGAAGLAGALQLARSRRSVVVVDAGQPRNAPASHVHAYLGHDGRPPADFLAIGREEVRRYGGVILEGTATALEPRPEEGRIRVALADGRVLSGRRVLIATGLLDELPDIPGVAEQWGRGVVHCPYCHGWEVRDRAIVVIATGPMATHQALLFRQLSDRVCMVVHEGPGPDPEDRRRLAARGVRIEDGPAASLVTEGDEVRSVRLADGRTVAAGAVVVAPRFVARAGLLSDLGLVPVAAPMGTGEVAETDARGATTVPGVFAAGNVADVAAQVLQAAAEGSRVGAVINADLVDEDATLAAEVMPGEGADDWDRRYTGAAQLFSGHVNGALVAEVDGLAPGRALDVGCGEGADAIWLARAGWEVTAVDISPVAIQRARGVGADAGVVVEWVAADITVEAPAVGRYDLVSVHYPALRRSVGDVAVGALLGAVAPGGVLLVVGHDLAAAGHHHPGFDPADYVQPADVAGHLDDAWTIEVHEQRPRVPPPGYEGPDVPDIVLRARRRRP